MEQFEVIKQVTLVMARMLEHRVAESVGEKIPVRLEYSPECKQGKGSLTLVHCSVKTRPGHDDREYEAGRQGERFRNPPLLLQSRYMVSAWAKPPEDQALLGAAMRVFLDYPTLELGSMEEEEVIGYAGTPTVTMESIPLAEHKLLADAFGMPLAPSIGYWVDYRLRSSLVTPIKRVLERVTDFRKIDG